MTLRTSPLDAAHRALGAKMVPFGGWDMPLSYGDGTIAEHKACRTGGVVFDVSHLGTVRVEGAGLARPAAGGPHQRPRQGGARAARSTPTCSTRPTRRCSTTSSCGGSTTSVFDVMPNASNTERVVAAIGGEDVTATRAIIAVQGPAAREHLATIAPEAAAIGRFRVGTAAVAGAECTVAGTGYTGEDGVELAVPADAAPAVWEALLATGLLPAGLGARDTLRLEAALPLHGHELGPGHHPAPGRARLGGGVGQGRRLPGP